jgi:hypothetical protein
MELGNPSARAGPQMPREGEIDSFANYNYMYAIYQLCVA